MKFIIIIISVIFSSEIFAGKFTFHGEAGIGRISVMQNYKLEKYSDSSVINVVLAAIGGYKFDSNFIIGVAANYYVGWDDFTASDSADVQDVSVVVGYSFDLNTNGWI